jgi:acyl carrier protein
MKTLRLEDLLQLITEFQRRDDQALSLQSPHKRNKSLDGETLLEELGLDSIDIAEMSIRIEENWGIPVRIELFYDDINLHDFVQAVNNAANGGDVGV